MQDLENITQSAAVTVGETSTQLLAANNQVWAATLWNSGVYTVWIVHAGATAEVGKGFFLPAGAVMQFTPDFAPQLGLNAIADGGECSVYVAKGASPPMAFGTVKNTAYSSLLEADRSSQVGPAPTQAFALTLMSAVTDDGDDDYDLSIGSTIGHSNGALWVKATRTSGQVDFYIRTWYEDSADYVQDTVSLEVTATGNYTFDIPAGVRHVEVFVDGDTGSWVGTLTVVYTAQIGV